MNVDINVFVQNKTVIVNIPGLTMLSLVAKFGFFTMFHQVTVTAERTKPRNVATATAAITNQMIGDAFSGSDSNC